MIAEARSKEELEQAVRVLVETVTSSAQAAHDLSLIQGQVRLKGEEG